MNSIYHLINKEEIIIRRLINNKKGYLVPSSICLALGISLTLYIIPRIQPSRPISFAIAIFGTTISILWSNKLDKSFEKDLMEHIKEMKSLCFEMTISEFMDSDTYSSSLPLEERLR